MILVVGATGQLGTAVVRKLKAAAEPVRAFVRPSADAGRLRSANVEIVLGDLRDAPSVEAACAGADVIVATANTVVPRARYSFAADEGEGYRNLLAAARRHRVARFVFMSVPVTPHDDAVPTFRFKRLVERLLMDSGIRYTIFRGSAFMDDWFALLGSSIPLRGAEAATLRRPFWFARAFMRGTGRLIERRGVALVPGSGASRHAFVALDDVASFLVRAAGRTDAGNAVLELGGPEVLSWDDVVALFGSVLGRDIRALHVPAGVFRFAQRLLNPFSPAAANLMGLSWTLATVDTPYDVTRLAAQFGVELTRAEAFLRAKLALPESA